MVNIVDICQKIISPDLDEISNWDVDKSTLHQWCYTDDSCSHQYYQRRGEFNETIFSALAQSVYYKFEDLYGPLRTFICEADSEEKLLKNLWILVLNSDRDHASIALNSVNQRISINPKTLSMEIECEPDLDCEIPTSDLTFLYILFSVLAFGLGSLILLNVCKTSNLFPFLEVWKTSY